MTLGLAIGVLKTLVEGVRVGRVRSGAFLTLLTLVLFAGPASGATGRVVSVAPAARILYVSDWSGSDQIYSIDPAHPGSVAQITFGVPRGCSPLEDVAPSCAIVKVAAAPDGRRIAYVVSGPGANYCRGELLVAGADGRTPRELGGQVDACSSTVVAWAPDSRRLAYEGYVPGWDENVYSVDVTRPDHLRYAGVTSAYDGRFAWSPDGHSIATDRGVTQVVGRATAVRTYSGVFQFEWAPNGKWLALDRGDNGLGILDVATGEERQWTGAGINSLTGWPSDSRFLAYHGYGYDFNALFVLDLATGESQRLSSEEHVYGSRPDAWSSRGDLLAFDSIDGLAVFDVSSGTTHAVSADHTSSLVWSPDGRSIAYVVQTPYARETTFLRIATTDGRVQTVVDGSQPEGGDIRSFTWIRPRGTVRYRRPDPRMAATVSPTGLVARWPIEHLAADGSRVAYVSCEHVFVWTPGTDAVVQVEPAATLIPFCSTAFYERTSGVHSIYDLAVARDRIAFGTVTRDQPYSSARTKANVTHYGWNLWDASVSAPGEIQAIDKGVGNLCTHTGDSSLGDLVGGGDLLVFSRWVYAEPPFAHCGGAPVASQTIVRVAGGCPCADLASSPGPLLPADVDGGRVVAFGTNETLLLDATGAELLDLPVSPLAAQLSGNDLVLALQGELRDYDATTGALMHAWPLPNVPTGSECGSPKGIGDRTICPAVRLVIEDAAHGLVAYSLDGTIHLLRLSDGADVAVGAGNLARFMDAGLVYANGANLTLLPWTKMPLR